MQTCFVSPRRLETSGCFRTSILDTLANVIHLHLNAEYLNTTMHNLFLVLATTLLMTEYSTGQHLKSSKDGEKALNRQVDELGGVGIELGPNTTLSSTLRSTVTSTFTSSTVSIFTTSLTLTTLDSTPSSTSTTPQSPPSQENVGGMTLTQIGLLIGILAFVGVGLLGVVLAWRLCRYNTDNRFGGSRSRPASLADLDKARDPIVISSTLPRDVLRSNSLSSIVASPVSPPQTVVATVPLYSASLQVSHARLSTVQEELSHIDLGLPDNPPSLPLRSSSLILINP
jgi:hypothetical protein